MKQIEDRIRVNTEKALQFLVQKIQEKISTPYPPASSAGNPPHMRSGDLYESIRYEFNRRWLTGKILADSPYAAPLELGSKNQAARPFIVNTIDEHWERAVRIMRGE